MNPPAETFEDKHYAFLWTCARVDNACKPLSSVRSEKANLADLILKRISYLTGSQLADLKNSDSEFSEHVWPCACEHDRGQESLPAVTAWAPLSSPLKPFSLVEKEPESTCAALGWQVLYPDVE